MDTATSKRGLMSLRLLSALSAAAGLMLPFNNSIAAELAAASSPESDFNLRQTRIWAGKCGPESAWEICFEGKGIPGSNQAPHLNWDNPIDDDWDDAISRRDSWTINLMDASGTHFMRVDRTGSLYEKRTGHFWRRDEFLTAEAGFEAQFRVRILPQSQKTGVKLHFFDDRHEFKVVFSPTQISFHPQIGESSPALATVNRRNTSMTVFTVRKTPVTGEVLIWANGVRLLGTVKLLPKGSSLLQSMTGYLGRIAPRIGFGDNNNFVSDGQGAYEIKYFRYRRAWVASGRAGLRSPAPLPQREDCSANYAWNTLRDNSSQIAFQDSKLGDAMPDVVGNKFGRSLEFSAKLLASPGNAEGYSFEYTDKLGGILVTIYPDRIEMKPNGKPGVPAIARIDGFNGFNENRFRLVRIENGLYWHLYLNGSPIPVLAFIRSSGFSPHQTDPEIGRQVLLVGNFTTPNLMTLPDGVDTAPRVTSGARAAVPLIRWLDRALGTGDCR